MTNAELIKALRKCGKASADRCWDCDYYDREPLCESALANDAADALEAADKRIAEMEAQLPKEGEWMFSRGDGKTCVDGWTCSACGNSFHTNVPYFEEYHYCPNCGANMKKGEEK